MKERICEKCGKRYMPINNNQKYCCKECQSIAEKEHRHKYYLKYHEQEMQKANQYYLEHSQFMKENHRQWNKSHLEVIKKYRKQYYLKNSEIEKEYNKQWIKKNPEKFKEQRRRETYKRDHNLGFYPLNEYFDGSEFHHINKERGLYIPIKLHQSIPHNIFTGKNMKEINLIAFDFWLTQGFKHLKEQIDKRQVFC